VRLHEDILSISIDFMLTIFPLSASGSPSFRSKYIHVQTMSFSSSEQESRPSSSKELRFKATPPPGLSEYIAALPRGSLSPGEIDALQLTFEACGARLELIPFIFAAFESARTLQSSVGEDVGIPSSISSSRIIVPLSSDSISNLFTDSSREALYGASSLSEALATANGIRVGGHRAEPEIILPEVPIKRGRRNPPGIKQIQ